MSWLTIKIGRFIHSALTEAKKARDANNNQVEVAPALAALGRSHPAMDDQPETSFSIIKCANGRILKVSSFKPVKGPGSDWTHELHIVREGEKISDVITRIMAIKAMEN